MISIFATCHPFRTQMDRIQRASILNWQKAPFEHEIILVGNEFGIAEVCEEYGLRHLPLPPESYHLGTFLCDDMLRRVRAIARGGYLCSIMGDILVEDWGTLWEGLDRYRKQVKRFYAVARSWHHKEGHPTLQTPYRIDFSVFPVDMEWEWPHVLVGRPRADTTILWSAKRELEVPTIDVTNSLRLVHQDHTPVHNPTLWKEGREFNENEARGLCHVLQTSLMLNGKRVIRR